MRIIVGICGYKGSGKSTAAAELHRLGFTRIRFAQGLKAMLMAFGLSEAQVDGDQKEVPTPLLMGQTPRHAMQTLGAQWGRDLIHDDLWIENWKHRVISTPEHIPVVADDLRYPNEVKAIKELGGVIWMISRPGFERSSEHSSEDLSHIKPDLQIANELDQTSFELRIRNISFDLRSK